MSALISQDPATKTSLQDELHMVKGMMQEYPKCYWLWNHRRWCLEELSRDHMADWDYELALVLKVLERDSRNFHGWHYRRYVVAEIEREQHEKFTDAEETAVADLKLYFAEYRYATFKIEKNISNFSAWHNRAKLIPRIFQLLENFTNFEALAEYRSTADLFRSPLALLHYELGLVKTGMFMDAADTSVWLFMRWLLTDDIFVADLKKSSEETYLQILEQQLLAVKELNELEKEDSPNNADDVGCVKMMVFIKALINQQNSHDNLQDPEIREHLALLAKIDPIRKGRFMDQMTGSSPLTF